VLEAILSVLEHFPDAVLAGTLIAAVCAFLGVFVILKRVVFIGIALSETAAAGIATAMIFHFQPFLGAALFALVTVTVLAYPFETDRIPRDAILGVIFVLASGMSILIVANSGFGLNEVRALLYGGLILTTRRDLYTILCALLPVLAYLLLFLRPTLYTFLDREAAKVLGVRVALWELLYFYALGLAVSASSKVAGALLVFCYLVVAPSTALLLSRRLWAVILIAISASVLATHTGLVYSAYSDLPTNHVVAVSACVLFAFALCARGFVAATSWLLHRLGFQRDAEGVCRLPHR